jgi:hypothetical protein
VIVEGLVIYPSLKKEDLAECVQISCLLRSRIWMLCACKKLDKDNKEEELVGVAPGWG